MKPISPSTSFHQRLISVNALDIVGFGTWLLHPGMLFGSHTKWWGDMGRRSGPHEGLDLCFYRTATGSISHLDDAILIPVVFAGKVVSVIDDFLGQSAFVQHTGEQDRSHLYTVYGHLRPFAGIQPGNDLAEGDIIGTVADAREKNAAIPSHLHISAAWIPDSLRPEELDWKLMADPHKINLLDPLSVIACPYTIV